MPEEILINVTTREVRIAFLEENILQDIQIERHVQQGIIGNIYKGKITRLLPGIQAAFVDIGLEKAAFLHVKDLLNYVEQTDIRELLKPGQELLVQVYKDPLGSKGARLTTQFSIPARYLVYTPYTSDILVSQKITDEEERARLMDLISNNKNGYIFRTAAVGTTKEKIDADIQFLKQLWQDISERSLKAKAGDAIYVEIPLVFRVLRDVNHLTIEKIRVDDQETAILMQDFAEKYIPELKNRIEYYDDVRPIFDIHGVEDDLKKALMRKINLKSGGHLIFDQTEAMTTIDVNTGSYLGKNKNSEETIFKTNTEAVDVIARQIRLRNLGGIIIIDFIDMLDSDNKTALLNLLSKALEKDSARIEISEISSLGLVQMTRKRTRESLEHILCVTCPLCHRRGTVKSVQTLSYDILRELKLTFFHYPDWPGYMIYAAENVIDYINTDEIELLKRIETKIQKPIYWVKKPELMQDHFEILPADKN